jgi:hypothetical protein
MELASLTDERPSKRTRPGHGETVYMQQSTTLESSPHAAWRPQFRHWSAEAGKLEFECRWPSCDHRSSTVEADAEHLQSHVVRKRSDVFRTRIVAQLRADDADAAAPGRPTAAWRLPAPVLTLPSAAAPAPSPPLSPPCSAASDNEPSHQQWRTSRPRTGNRIPLDRRTNSGGASARFKCGRPDCSYIALRRSHLIQHELTHSGQRPFGTPPFAPPRATHSTACSADLWASFFPACEWPKCTYRASRNATLAEHMRTHTGQRYVSWLKER